MISIASIRLPQMLLTVLMTWMSVVMVVQAQSFVDLVPSTGVLPGTPGCVGDIPSPVRAGVMVPCRCPPTAEAIASSVAQRLGDVGMYPRGLDLESRIRRYELAIQAVQALQCPASSTRMKSVLDALTSLRGNPNANQIVAGLPLNAAPRR